MADYGVLLEGTIGLSALAAVAVGANVLWRVYRSDQYAIEDAWEARLRKAALQLVKIGPQMVVKETNQDSVVPLYETIFPDPRFRTLIEQHLVETDRKRTRFMPRTPRPAQIRDPVLRATVERAETLLEDFRQSHPEIAKTHMN